jgi:hypothetical protein
VAVRPASLHDELFFNYQGQSLSVQGMRKLLAMDLQAPGQIYAHMARESTKKVMEATSL